MSHRTREQERARLALNAVKAVPSDQRDDFKSQVRRLPSRIVTAGLLGSLAFLEAKASKSKGIERLIKALTEAVQTCDFDEGLGQNETLLRKLAEAKDDIYLRQVTDEVMAYTSWLKRMVEAHYA
ncbi:MAG: type III-B CRISPR module-associated protein Cmr5 [Planctomycetota bacterium]|nr:type III-B CRISPR module-associated protein Cmr5 [Planctomycetota bacterium]